MFDIGWSELLFFAVLVLLIMGPSELPVILRHVGRYVARGRAMAQEFYKHVDEMAADVDLHEIKDAAKQLTPSQAKSRFADAFRSPDLFDSNNRKSQKDAGAKKGKGKGQVQEKGKGKATPKVKAKTKESKDNA